MFAFSSCVGVTDFLCSCVLLGTHLPERHGSTAFLRIPSGLLGLSAEALVQVVGLRPGVLLQQALQCLNFAVDVGGSCAHDKGQHLLRGDAARAQTSVLHCRNGVELVLPIPQRCFPLGERCFSLIQRKTCLFLLGQVLPPHPIQLRL